MTQTPGIKSITRLQAAYAFEYIRHDLQWLKNQAASDYIVQKACRQMPKDCDQADTSNPESEIVRQKVEEYLSQLTQQTESNNDDPVINTLKATHLKYQAEYTSRLKKLPMLIKTNGLGNVLTFLLAKGYEKGSPCWLLLDQIARWLTEEPSCLPVTSKTSDAGQFIQEIIQQNSPLYRQLTKKTLALLVWMGRFAEGLLSEANNEVVEG
ncbi:MAG: type III-B CRISPR module-associated protein Cmr5 [Bacillota bacterium]